jgi:hypothetical protein
MTHGAIKEKELLLLRRRIFMKRSKALLSSVLCGSVIFALGIASPAHAAEGLTIEDAIHASTELKNLIAENRLTSADEAENDPELDCQEVLPPGGWTSFPLACRRFVGKMEVATDANFHHVVATFGIEQKGRLTLNRSGEAEYRFSLKLGAIRMHSEAVVWQDDRSYRIGKKIDGLCTPESDPASPKVVCRAYFHGIMSKLAGGYVETYSGPGLNQIDLQWANAKNGHSPLLHWRARLTEAK